MNRLFYIVTSILLSGLMLIPGCESTDPGNTGPKEAYVPREGKIRVRLSANTARGQVNLSRFVYVFPPLKVNEDKELIDQLIPQEREDEGLYWITTVHGAGELKLAIEKSLRSQGYTTVTFNALESVETDHSVMVMNPYYSGRLPAEDNETGRIAYTRITVATYPASLNPAGRIEVINQEAVSVYHQADSHLDALKKAFDYSIRNIGVNREWLMDLNIKD